MTPRTQRAQRLYLSIIYSMDNRQQIADALQKGLQLIVPASVQQGGTRLTRLSFELWAGQMSMLYNNGESCSL